MVLLLKDIFLRRKMLVKKECVVIDILRAIEIPVKRNNVTEFKDKVL
jgi:hypothetical protein